MTVLVVQRSVLMLVTIVLLMVSSWFWYWYYCHIVADDVAVTQVNIWYLKLVTIQKMFGDTGVGIPGKGDVGVKDITFDVQVSTSTLLQLMKHPYRI